MKHKGIVLAGGSGTRMYPLTQGLSKQLLPVYNKPMIYYPISVLMLSDIKDILVITTSKDLYHFQALLGDGSQFGINLSYAIQKESNGIAEAFIIGESFIKNSPVSLILGDNLFYGQSFLAKLNAAKQYSEGACVFGYQVKDPQRFGVIEFDENNNVLSIEEKPENPRSRFAVTGLYFYDEQVVDIAKSITPSNRGELEITDVNNIYLQQNQLYAELLGRGFAWLDTGTHDSLLEAGQFIQTIEHRQGFKVACLEELAFSKGWISRSELRDTGDKLSNSDYGKYLIEIAEQG